MRLTLSLSSNFNPLNRGSKLASGLSLFVGDPPRTYSTIFTPSPPVESRGLKKHRNYYPFFELTRKSHGSHTSKFLWIRSDSCRARGGRCVSRPVLHRPEMTRWNRATPDGLWWRAGEAEPRNQPHLRWPP